MSAISKRIQLATEWKKLLASEIKQPYMLALYDFLQQRRAVGTKIYPAQKNHFAAFNRTPLSRVKVVILGQDPYHGPKQANGLCFSVPQNIALPPSLQNIYKELHSDLGIAPVAHGCLDAWAEQGVFLLNSVLTVEQGKPGAHQGKGWERFTDRVITVLNEQRESLVFLLWGSYAQKKAAFVDRSKHLVLTAAHPSPLSAHRGFFGCRHFSKTNQYLRKRKLGAIDWQL